jgi:hypothetical protein
LPSSVLRIGDFAFADQYRNIDNAPTLAVDLSSDFNLGYNPNHDNSMTHGFGDYAFHCDTFSEFI